MMITLLNGNTRLFVHFNDVKNLHFFHTHPPIIEPTAQLSLAVLIYEQLTPELRAAMRKALDVIDNPPPTTAT